MPKNTNAFYSRLRANAGITENTRNDSVETYNATLIESLKAKDNIVYGVVKENHKYIIKKSTSQKDVLNESDFVYINGFQNRNSYAYKNVGSATKNLGLFVRSINEGFDNNPSVNLNNRIEELNNGGEEETGEEETIDAGNDIEDLPSSNDGEEIPTSDDEEKPEGGEEGKSEEGEDISLDNIIQQIEDLDNDIKNLPSNDNGGEGGDQNDIDGNDLQDIINSELPDNGAEDDAANDAANAEPGLDAGIENTDMPAAQDAAVTPEDGGSAEGGGGEEVKSIESAIGKLGYTLRTANLTPEQSQSFLRSFVSGMKPNLEKIDPDERRKIASEIMNPTPEAAEKQNAVNKDQQKANDINKAIDDKLGNMEESKFKQYVESRGVTAEMIAEGRCSEMEMAEMLSGYANDNDDIDDSELSKIAIYVTPNVLKHLLGYGHDGFTDKLKDRSDAIGDDEKIIYGSEYPSDEKKFDLSDIENAEGNEEGDEDDEKEVAVEIPDEDNKEPKISEDNEMDALDNEEQPDLGGDTDESKKESTVIEDLRKRLSMLEERLAEKETIYNLEEEKKKLDANKDGMGFAKEDSLNEAKHKEIIAKYVVERIEILNGTKKENLHEGVKSENVKMLDKLIEEEFNKYHR